MKFQLQHMRSGEPNVHLPDLVNEIWEGISNLDVPIPWVGMREAGFSFIIRITFIIFAASILERINHGAEY